MNNHWQGHHPHHLHGNHQWQNNSFPPRHPQHHDMSNWHRRITIHEAMEIANQQVPGEIVKVELEREHGMLIYEVEIVTQQGVKYEVEINVDTGEVLNVKLD